MGILDKLFGNSRRKKEEDKIEEATGEKIDLTELEKLVDSEENKNELVFDFNVVLDVLKLHIDMDQVFEQIDNYLQKFKSNKQLDEIQLVEIREKDALITKELNLKKQEKLFNKMILFVSFYPQILKAYLNDYAYNQFEQKKYNEGLNSVAQSISLQVMGSSETNISESDAITLAGYLDTFSLGLYLKGNYEDALKISNILISLSPNHNYSSEHLTNRGKSKLKLDDKEGAKSDFEKALEKDENFEEAKNLLQILKQSNEKDVVSKNDKETSIILDDGTELVFSKLKDRNLKPNNYNLKDIHPNLPKILKGAEASINKYTSQDLIKSFDKIKEWRNDIAIDPETEEERIDLDLRMTHLFDSLDDLYEGVAEEWVYSELIDLQQEYSDLLNDYAYFLIEEKEYDKASYEINKAINMSLIGFDPNRPRRTGCISLYLNTWGDIKKAEGDYQSALLLYDINLSFKSRNNHKHEHDVAHLGNFLEIIRLLYSNNEENIFLWEYLQISTARVRNHIGISIKEGLDLVTSFGEGTHEQYDYFHDKKRYTDFIILQGKELEFISSNTNGYLKNIPKTEPIELSLLMRLLSCWISLDFDKGHTIADIKSLSSKNTPYIYFKFEGETYHINADTTYGGVSCFLNNIYNKNNLSEYYPWEEAIVNFKIILNNRGKKNKVTNNSDSSPIKGFYTYKLFR